MSEQNFSIPGLNDLQSPVSDALEKLVYLEPHDSNNSQWIGIASIGPIQINGEPPANDAAEVTMTFYQGSYPAQLVLSSTDSDEIVIEAAATWEFSVPAQPLPLPPGLWDWMLKVKDTQNVTTRLFKGQIIVRP